MGLSTPEGIREFQRKLYSKSKEEPDFRFYSLMDKITHPGVLKMAYRKCRESGKAPGVDGRRFEDIQQDGVDQFLDEIHQELESGEYTPSPVKRTMIDKPGGGKRPLGIPTIKDRVVQMATKIVIEPIFEANFKDNAYGYRPDRSATDAVKRLHEAVRKGKRQVVDADLSSYFDTIPHDQLMEAVANRISDGSVLSLIKGWLKVPVQIEDQDGNTHLKGGKASDGGTPQGGVISPLLANIYMNRMLKAWEQQGMADQLDAELINYADDFVIATEGKAEQAMEWIRKVVDRLGLKLNQEKSSIREVDEEEGVEFLGYEVGWKVYKKNGSTYIGLEPSRESVDRFKEMLTRFLDGSLTDSWMEVYEKLRRKILGWVSYYRHGSKYDAFKEINNHLYQRLRNYFRRTGREFGGGLSSSVTYFVKECLDPFKWARKLDDNSVSDLL